jgi:hypothetical protein
MPGHMILSQAPIMAISSVVQLCGALGLWDTLACGPQGQNLISCRPIFLKAVVQVVLFRMAAAGLSAGNCSGHLMLHGCSIMLDCVYACYLYCVGTVVAVSSL